MPSLERAVEQAGLPGPALRLAERELLLLARASPTSPEAVRTRTHLEWLLALRWPPGGQEAAAAGEAPPPRFAEVEKALEQSHVGLSEVKGRIAEFLAVRQLGGGARGTVLCFVGPPGTGKSSMGRALAAALCRPFVTIPVGAVTYESEIVGVAAEREGGMPGAILAGVHRSGASNPVILLDEIDKLCLGGEGTASGVFMQILDPEQNSEFLDHYLGVPYDLSRCLILATANDAEQIPAALLDRMETIEFCGYTASEKYAIARHHLLPRALSHAGLEPRNLRITPAALRAVIRGYTEEAGVRQLQRSVIALARKAAVRVVGGDEGLRVRRDDLGRLLGPPPVEEDLRLRRPTVGVATGLAWTSVGGALLPVEALAMPGEGRLILTGLVGEVMRESVQTAISFLRTCYSMLDIEPTLFSSIDIHLHFPSAATPKDGPSAGIAVATALVSLLTHSQARHDVAMTGEISLLGHVLPVGGVREKLLAAIRAGIPAVVLPTRNAQDVLRLPAEIRRSLSIHLVSDVQEAIAIAISRRPARRPAVQRSRPATGKAARTHRGKRRRR